MKTQMCFMTATIRRFGERLILSINGRTLSKVTRRSHLGLDAGVRRRVAPDRVLPLLGRNRQLRQFASVGGSAATSQMSETTGLSPSKATQ